MASSRMPDEFMEVLEPLIPPDEPVGPSGGRPRVLNRIVLPVIWYVLTSGVRWADILPAMGCSGRTAHRRLQTWQRLGVWDALHAKLLELLNAKGKLDLEVVAIDSTMVPAPGAGDNTGPNPTDRGKTGSKHTLMVDGNGTPLAIITTGANVSDQQQLEHILKLFPHVKGGLGRPKQRPDIGLADRGYDSEHNREFMRSLGIHPLIAKRNTEHGSGLGKLRWVVERTNSWLKGLRRMRVRWDRSTLSQNAWNMLAMSAICFRIWCEFPV